MSCSWNHRVSSLFILTSFTWQYAFKVPWQYAFPWFDRSCLDSALKLFHHLDVPQLVDPFTYWRMSWLHPRFVSRESNCHKYLCAGFCVDMLFNSLSKFWGAWLLAYMIRIYLFLLKTARLSFKVVQPYFKSYLALLGSGLTKPEGFLRTSPFLCLPPLTLSKLC